MSRSLPSRPLAPPSAAPAASGLPANDEIKDRAYIHVMLTPEEVQRYKRQLMLKEVGGAGQQKLKAARVLVVGAGGIGSPLILYLAAAGIGTIGVVDFDRVSLSNLQRQIAHRTADIGRLKTDSAADSAHAINPGITVRP